MVLLPDGSTVRGVDEPISIRQRQRVSRCLRGANTQELYLHFSPLFAGFFMPFLSTLPSEMPASGNLHWLGEGYSQIANILFNTITSRGNEPRGVIATLVGVIHGQKWSARPHSIGFSFWRPFEVKKFLSCLLQLAPVRRLGSLIKHGLCLHCPYERILAATLICGFCFCKSEVVMES